jgi:hypothetical protein
MVETMAQQWARILAHLKSLRDANEDAPRHKRRHAKHHVSPVVQSFARAEMKRRQCHKG